MLMMDYFFIIMKLRFGFIQELLLYLCMLNENLCGSQIVYELCVYKQKCSILDFHECLYNYS